MAHPEIPILMVIQLRDAGMTYPAIVRALQLRGYRKFTSCSLSHAVYKAMKERDLWEE